MQNVTTKHKKTAMQEANLKQQFDDILESTVVPVLKGLGFKKKELHFNRSLNEISQCLNIQKSKWNSYDESISFTFNLGFYYGKINSVLSEKEESILSPQVNDCFIQGRIGNLTKRKDHWYELNNKESFEVIREQVAYHIKCFLIPHFEKYNFLENLVELVDKNEGDRIYMISPMGKFIFLMITNQKEVAAKHIKVEYKNALNPQETTHTINYPNGTSKVYTSKPHVNQVYVDFIKKISDYYEIEL
ncbi:hypothetical protein FHS59_004703 [Algoriphagus iocasae]|uniref:DUF4304 domain-containing protein n=1 Tax=Algoriphagus iocasae TaxID=1836499 RepID=A0A841MTE4_9BACT|nr:DUF4304 domain-containing protein [Algoriphagus iocasae]MBB6329039.1 hypothetical protein [Algoriphagus iocasae]